ncbi:MAG: CDP-glycerol glycerophosphotransferase family protein [Thermoanaerobaculia bacterium]
MAILGSRRKSVLFTGYAPVHFLCFRPLYEHFAAAGEIEVRLSGGLRRKTAAGVTHDPPGLYDPFGIPAEHVLPVEEIRRRNFDVLFAANTQMILPRSAHRRVQIFHGISFRNRAVRGSDCAPDHYFIVGPYMRRACAAAGLIAADDPRGLEIGFPKTDRLLNGELDRGRLLAAEGLTGERPVVLYAPTGLRHNSLETMGEEVIRRLAASARYDLLIKLHDHPKNTAIDWRRRLEPLLGRHTKLASSADVVPLLALADLLVSDASSVSSEYSLLDRPMVFLDVPQLLARERQRPDSMLDLETWGRRGGALVEHPEEIVDAVAEALAHPERHTEVRREMVGDLFYHPGGATRAALAWFDEVLADEL